MNLFKKILASRGLDAGLIEDFLHPDYAKLADPFLLPDMNLAVDRIVKAHHKQEKIIIYGDYDIDGLTATTLMNDALKALGFLNISTFIPSRFDDGYGLSKSMIKKIANDKYDLIVTVDCGSLSEPEIILANELGVDVIVTDHHTVAENQPPAIAVINPKRVDNKYPFIELAGVGVAFALIRALMTKLDGLNNGQEKWLLDLVALGTVCDIVPLVGENRINTYWGLKVLEKVRRPGLRALMAVAKIDPKQINARALGFGLGPRLNASGRLETAKHSLDLLMCNDPMKAFELAEYLDNLNTTRRNDQNKIFKEASIQAEKYSNDDVLVLSGDGWNHGIVGIVASKILEKYKKPVFVMEEMGEITKGSARSFGDFSVIEAVNNCRDLLSSGGGHKLAAGISLTTDNVENFRQKINEFYKNQKLENQQELLLPRADVVAKLDELDFELIKNIDLLEPFGNGNSQPILKTENLTIKNIQRMGADGQHIKLKLFDENQNEIIMVGFNFYDKFILEVGQRIDVLYHVSLNEWNGNRSIEGTLLHIEQSKI